MTWQHHILTWLAPEKTGLKIVTDRTGVLSGSGFTRFLTEEGVTFLAVEDESSLLRIHQQHFKGLVISKVEPPYFIARKTPNKTFAHENLPLNGERHLLKTLTDDELSCLLDYCYQTDPHIVISPHNLPELLEKSKRIGKEKQLEADYQLLEELLQSTPEPDVALQAGKLWGTIQFQSWQLGDESYQDWLPKLDNFSERFISTGGMEQAIVASTHFQPRTVDRILGNIKSEQPEKLALVCFDCMGMVEWELLKNWLTSFQETFEETALFALLPTVTAISRSAIFSGSRDVYNLKNPGRATEPSAFANFFPQNSTRYFTYKEEISDDSLLGYDAVALLYTFFDDLAHSAQFPSGTVSKRLYFNSVLNWLDHSSVKSDLKTLLRNGFSLYFCSDHGSTVATGNGQKLVRYIQETFAKRGCLIAAENQELTAYRRFPVPFQGGKVIVIPEGRQMFGNQGVIEINHGGISLDEMVVPFIKVKPT
ncbi:MAG: PglZ domain-containing protein [Saprospiraceae bacterium]